MPIEYDIFQDFWWIFLLSFFVSLFVSFVATRLMVSIALHFDWTAKSNARSSHTGQLAFGGGASVLLVILGAWALGPILLGPNMFGQNTLTPSTFGTLEISVLLSIVLLAGVSWLDDLRPLPPATRFILQLLAIGVVLFLLPSERHIIPVDMPLIADRLIAGFFWLWFINLFNFMDGIDGLAGVETFAISCGVLLIAFVVGMAGNVPYLALIVMGAIGGFLPWNWHRAQIMLGDIGSIPLGFLLGYLLIQLALSGHLLAALILPAYFATDASVTLIRRVLNGEKFLQPHATHFYQRAVQAGYGHDKIVLRVGIANVGLITCAIISLNQPILALVLAVGIVSLLMFVLIRMAKGNAQKP